MLLQMDYMVDGPGRGANFSLLSSRRVLLGNVIAAPKNGEGKKKKNKNTGVRQE